MQKNITLQRRKVLKKKLRKNKKHIKELKNPI